MSTISPAVPTETSGHAPAKARRRRLRGFYRPRSLWLVTTIGFVLLLAPIAVVVLFSFNSGRSLYVLSGFSTQWYSSFFRSGSIISSVELSFEIAFACMVICAILGTLTAFSLARGSRLVSGSMSGTVLARLLSPEIATGVGSLLLFTQLHIQLSPITITVAHVAFSFVYVAVVVRSRLVGLNPELELAAQDLGVSPMKATRLVALPLVWPAIVASSLLVFVFSFDDFVTSYFTTGAGVPPLPVRIYAMLRFGLTPVVNAIGVVMLVTTGAVAIAAYAMFALQSRRDSAVPETLPDTPVSQGIGDVA